MFKNKFVLGIIVVGIVGAVAYMCGSAPTYAEKALKEREQYTTSLLTMKDSPVKGSSGLHFFEPDENWVFEADFKRADGDKTFIVQMTDSTSESSELAGYAALEIQGRKYNLMVFDEGATFLLPFRDVTNGQETYGGGRYISIDKGRLVGKKLTIDFNQSHNFYCAYDESFICPIPPKENTLAVAVRAGELNYQKH